MARRLLSVLLGFALLGDLLGFFLRGSGRPPLSRRNGTGVDPLVRTQTPTPTEAVTSLALWLRQEADALGLKLSVVMESDALRSSDTVLHGQDAALLFRVFDRVAAATDFDHVTGDLAALDAAMEQPDENRALLITDNYAPERQSYIVR